jgi:hypothetical protein
MKLIGNLSESLTPPHRVAVLASLGDKIKTLPPDSITKPLIVALGEAYEALGQKSSESMTSLVKLLRIELMTYFSTYTLEEVNTSIKMGVTGKLCELSTLPMPIISVSNICKFIHLYNEKVRREALHEQRKFEEKNNADFEEQKRIKGNAILDAEIELCKENYKSNKETLNYVPEDLRACYFRRIREANGKGLISIDVMNQILIIAESRHDTFEELPKQEQHYLSKSREELKWTKERDSAVKVTAQSMALQYLFDK